MFVHTENNRTFYAACVTNFLLRVEWGIATSFLPIHIYELGATPIEVGLVFTVFAAISVFSNPFWGGLSDSLGKRKRFIVIGMVGLLPIYVLMAFQKEVLPLILLRGSTALLKGAVVPSTWALVSDLSPPGTVGRNMGILSAFEVAGFAVGPALGGFVAEVASFSLLWLLVAAICLSGGLLFMFAGNDPVRLERTTVRPPFFQAVTSRAVMRKVLPVATAFAIFLFGFSFLGPNLNVYLIRDLGYSKAFIGTLSFLGTGVSTVLQLFSGHLSDEYGRKPVMALGALSLTGGHLILLLGGAVHWVILSQILISYYNTFQMAASAYVSEIVSPTEKSGALGLLTAIGSVARSSSSLAGGIVITWTSVPTTLTIAAAFPALSILVLLFSVKEVKGD
jgi:MFS family permease